MAKKKIDASHKDRFQFATLAKETAPHVQFPEDMNVGSLTSSHLEQWFANVERGSKRSKNPDSYFSTLFLNHFGFQHPIQVIEFLKSPEGKITLTMISQELMKIESLNQYKADMCREEALMRERRFVFLLMALIAKEKAHAKHVSELIQEQIDEKLKSMKPTAIEVDQKAVVLQILNANIQAYTNAIKAVDEKLIELKQHLSAVDKELAAIEEEEIQIAERHDILNDHMDHLNSALRLLTFHNKPMDLYLAHTNLQILSLTEQLTELKADHETYAIIESATSRKIRMLEERLAFYQDQLKNPPKDIEQVFQHLIARVNSRLEEDQPVMPLHEHEKEGLRLRHQGLHQALQIIRKEKALLNAQLKEVHDFEEAHFIINPDHKARYLKLDDVYAFCAEDKDPNNMSEQDWFEAKGNYQQLKPDVQVVNVQCQQQMQQQVEVHATRKQQQLEVRDQFLSHMGELKASKVQLLHALSSTKAQKALLAQTAKQTPQISAPKLTPEASAKEDIVDPDQDLTLGFFKAKGTK